MLSRSYCRNCPFLCVCLLTAPCLVPWAVLQLASRILSSSSFRRYNFNRTLAFISIFSGNWFPLSCSLWLNRRRLWLPLRFTSHSSLTESNTLLYIWRHQYEWFSLFISRSRPLSCSRLWRSCPYISFWLRPRPFSLPANWSFCFSLRTRVTMA